MWCSSLCGVARWTTEAERRSAKTSAHAVAAFQVARWLAICNLRLILSGNGTCGRNAWLVTCDLRDSATAQPSSSSAVPHRAASAIIRSMPLSRSQSSTNCKHQHQPQQSQQQQQQAVAQLLASEWLLLFFFPPGLPHSLGASVRQ